MQDKCQSVGRLKDSLCGKYHFLYFNTTYFTLLIVNAYDYSNVDHPYLSSTFA